MVSVEIARKDDACGSLPVLYRGCDGILYCCNGWLCRGVVACEERYWRYVDRKDKGLRVGCLDLNGRDIWVVARYLTVGGYRDSPINIDKAAEANYVGLRGGSVQSPGAMVDMCAVGGNRGLLDQENLQPLTFGIINQCLHSRSRFHHVQL